MKKFFYEARDRQTGNLFKGYMLAENEQEVVAHLQKDMYIILINSHNFYSLKESLKTRPSDLSRKNIIILCQQLSIMLEAGMNIIEALENLMNNSEDKTMRLFLEQTVNKLREGNSLSAIWKTKVLPPYLVSSLGIAEFTGMLAQTLAETADYLQQIEDERQKLRQICIYPIFLGSILFIVSNIMIFWVLPAFADVFSRMNLTLPLITRVILNTGLWLQQNYLLILICILMGIGLLLNCWRTKLFRLKCYKLLLKIPIYGAFWEKIYLMRVSRQLSFLLQSGISIDEGLQIILQGTHNEYVQKALHKVIDYLKQGFSLYSACKQLNLRNYIFVELINVGEQTGMLAKTLRYNDEFLAKEVDKFIQDFTKLLEPTLMIVMGLIVGIFVMAIVLPLFEIANNVGM